MNQTVQLVRPIDYNNIDNMILASMDEDEIELYFLVDFEGQEYYDDCKRRIQQKDSAPLTRDDIEYIREQGPFCIIDTTKDAETLFTLRFGPFERID